MSARTTEELLQLYWTAQRQRGDKPRPVHALLALEGAMHPKGTMIAWGVNLGYVENRKAALSYGDKYEIQLKHPEQEDPTP